jgi:hypothetical protein
MKYRVPSRSVRGSIEQSSMATYADKKSSKGIVRYQDRPRGDRQCAKCTMFRPPHACTAVAGTISPDGWCELYKHKPARKKTIAET